MTETALRLHPDRALPFPPEQRSIATEIYAETKDLPLICMHGHIEPQVFADDLAFADPAQLLIDTRAFPSIPARHDLVRRVDAGYLAWLVLEHRLDLTVAVETAIDLAYNLPKQSYERR